ncbi:MAG: type II toxin-antitoxin system VapC family toxin [Candidatus Palauibacterales bacterium]|nr:type II toxin-antitoxin system VapC family toxin [Candidatus Palauibacterales bacterium]
MIVVDTNVIAYLHLSGERTPAAEAAWKADPDWHAPLLWRSEFRNVLVLQMRRSGIELAEAERLSGEAERTMEGGEHLVRAGHVLRLADGSGRSAYDCEFVALAEVLDVPLVTADRALCASFPNRTSELEAFAG